MAAHSEKIAAEEIKCKAMTDNAQRDLDEALPALEEAMKVSPVLDRYITHEMNISLRSLAHIALCYILEGVLGIRIS